METNKLKQFLDSMVNKGKITKDEADEKLAKHEEKENAKAKYKTGKSKLNKAELQELLDTLCN